MVVSGALSHRAEKAIPRPSPGYAPIGTYYVWVQVNGLYRYNSLQQWQVRGYSANPRRKTITTLPAPSQTTPTPTPTAGHTHDYAAPGHSHSVPDHSHPVANHRHGYAAAQHTHSYAPADHTHAAGTGETTPAPAAAPGSSQTCPRFVELEDTWSGVSEYKENDGSVWVAVDAIEFLMEKTIPAGSVRDRDSDLEGVLIRLKHKPNGLARHRTRLPSRRRRPRRRGFVRPLHHRRRDHDRRSTGAGIAGLSRRQRSLGSRRSPYRRLYAPA